MSIIGRIFIVLNLALAFAFLGWASNALATNQEWKNQHAKLQTEMDAALDAKEAELGDVRTSLSQAEEESRQRREERDQYKTQLESANSQLAEAQRAGEAMQANLTRISATLNDYNDTISQLNSAKDRAVESAHEMERERDQAVADGQTAEQASRDAQDALRQTEVQIVSLEAERTTLREDLSRLETQIAMLVELTGTSVSDLVAQPNIDAAVLDVRHDLEPGLVMLNVGKNQEVKRGFTFEIYNGNQYKGQVRVANVQDDISSALILNAVDGTRIAQGDRASTNL